MHTVYKGRIRRDSLQAARWWECRLTRVYEEGLRFMAVHGLVTGGITLGDERVVVVGDFAAS
jgi:hypothetical protein